MKMHLAATAPNEGARGLARAISRDANEVCFRLCAQGIDAAKVERLLSGELIPGADMAYKIAEATRFSVRLSWWRRPAKGWWFAGMAPRTSSSQTMRAGIFPLLPSPRAGEAGGRMPLRAPVSPDSIGAPR